MTLRENIRRALRAPCTANFAKLFDFVPAKRGRHTTRFPGLCADAETLGVSRIHLYLVLSGQRRSARLISRFNQLKGVR